MAELECEENGWSVAERYEDRDRSASRRATKDREAWLRLVADVEAGKIDVIVYAERSRAVRRMDVFIELRELCERTGTLLCYGGRVYDMRKPADRREATRDALQAEEEAEGIIERNERTARLNAKRGSPHGKIQFGYSRHYDPDTGELIGQLPHVDHAEVAHDLFVRLTQGEAMLPLLATLRAYRPTATLAGLRRMFVNKAYIGVRVHHDAEYKAAWPAIVEEDLFWQVQEILKDPKRSTTPGPTPQYLLSGTARCPVCIATQQQRPEMRVRKHPRKLVPAGFIYRYQCYFGHVTVPIDLLDDYVSEAVLTYLGSPAATALFRGDVDAAEIERLRGRLATLQTHLQQAQARAGEFDPDTGVPRLSVEGLAAVEEKTIPLIGKTEERLRVLLAAQDPVLGSLIGLPPEQLDRLWCSDDFGLFRRRHVVRSVVRVVVNKAERRGQGMDDRRVTLIFRGEPGFDDWPMARAPYKWAKDW